MVKEFDEFLKRTRKKNGEKFMSSTVERYSACIDNYFNNLESLCRVSEFEGIVIKEISKEVIDYMNKHIYSTQNDILYASFIQYLSFRGIQINKRSGWHKELDKPTNKANSFNSIKFLQSKVLSKEELKVLINNSNLSMQLIFCMLYDTACRRTELLSIKFKDIKLSNPNTESGKKDIKMGIFASIDILGKGGKRRVVYLHRTSVSLLIKVYGTDFVMEKYVFEFRQKNNELYANQDSKLYELVVENSEKILGRHVSCHFFRHTRLTHLADNGMNAIQLMAYAGHSDIKMVLVYVQISSRTGYKGISEHSQDIMEAET